MRHVTGRLARAVRGWPIHRFVAVGLVAAMALPSGTVAVAFGHLWPAGPAPVRVLVAAVEIAPLWWAGRRPVLAVAVSGVGFLAAVAFAWPSISVDLSIFVALAVLGARARPRTAFATAGACGLALAGYMAAAQAPDHPTMVVEAVIPAMVFVSIPTMIGMLYPRVRRPADGGDRPAAPETAPPPTAAPAPPPPRAGVTAPPPRSAATAQPGAARFDPRLTAREVAILVMVAEGLTNTEIATKLTIGRETVKTHVGNILAKLGARDRTHAVALAYRHRLIDGS